MPQTASLLPVGTQAREEIFSGWISDLQPATSGLLQRQLARLAKEASGDVLLIQEMSNHGCPTGRALANGGGPGVEVTLAFLRAQGQHSATSSMLGLAAAEPALSQG